MRRRLLWNPMGCSRLSSWLNVFVLTLAAPMSLHFPLSKRLRDYALGSEYLKAVVPNTFYLQALSTLSIQANLYAYEIGMIALGLAGLMLNYMFYRAKLVPRWIAVWGLVGYASIFCRMVSEVMGSGLGLVSSIPGPLWGVFMGVWLTSQGFNSS